MVELDLFDISTDIDWKNSKKVHRAKNHIVGILNSSNLLLLWKASASVYTQGKKLGLSRWRNPKLATTVHETFLGSVLVYLKIFEKHDNLVSITAWFSHVMPLNINRSCSVTSHDQPDQHRRWEPGISVRYTWQCCNDPLHVIILD